jgi:hypothetical protein
VRLPPELIKLVTYGKRRQANHAWNEVFPTLPVSTRFAYTKLLYPFGRKDFYDQIRYLRRFDVSRLAGRIRAPTLVTDYEFDDFFAGQPRGLYGLLRSRKRLVRFTSEDGA